MLLVWICLMFISWLPRFVTLRRKPQRYISFSLYHRKSTWCWHDLIVDIKLITWLRQCLPSFSIARLQFFCKLYFWEWSTLESLHLIFRKDKIHDNREGEQMEKCIKRSGVWSKLSFEKEVGFLQAEEKVDGCCTPS